MADDTTTPPVARPPGPAALAAAIVGACLLILALSAGLVFFRNSQKARDTSLISQRLAKLQELRTAEDKALTTYAWADKDNKLVKLPIGRAMETVLPELQARRVGPSAVRAPSKTGPTDMPVEPLPPAAAPVADAAAAPADGTAPPATNAPPTPPPAAPPATP